jgi:hypothetical protein
MRRNALFCAAVLAAHCAAPLAAQDNSFRDLIQQNAAGALALYGLAALPDNSARTLLLDTGRDSRRTFDFRGLQIGGAFPVRRGEPLYFEGVLAFNRYDPVIFLGQGASASEVPVNWTSLAATVGLGWNFPVGEYLHFRPMGHLNIGRVQSDSVIDSSDGGGLPIVDTGFISGSGITVGGYGASAALIYNRRWADNREWDLSVRHTYLHIEPIAGDDDVIADSVAQSTVFWARYRWPTRRILWDRPVRGVADFSASYLSGDQGEALNTDWLTRIGVGGELDVTGFGVSWISATRLMFRYTRGDNLQGVSIGVEISF